MLEQLKILGETLLANQPVVFCRLVETRGSTPLKAGAVMLVFPDGSQSGSVGGGGMEAEVKRRALAVMQAGIAEVFKFQLANDCGSDDGPACGGQMQVLIEPLQGALVRNYYLALATRAEQGAGITEAVVYDASANGLMAPASFLFDEQALMVKSTVSENAEEAVSAIITQHLQPLVSRPRPYAAHGIAYLPILRRCRLVVVGGGDVSKAVADLSVGLGFELWVVDDREEFVSEVRFPRAARRFAGNFEEVLPKLDIGSDTYCLILTRGRGHDERALYFLAERGARYVGMIGSRDKIKTIFHNLQNEGVAAEVLRQVHAPVGIEIGSQTVAEIAVSICAELIAHRNLGFSPGRPQAIEM